jgi:hypothetical protein
MALTAMVMRSTIFWEKDTSVKAIFQRFHVCLLLGLFDPENNST